ncbi:MAG: YjiH family protein, partial [Candidatus Cellulosilyticum pullistercoris]|nr:YjiH family protein [Candidatus Cellulosilyticum pullistercoris]
MNHKHSSHNKPYSTVSVIKFILPSLLGIFLFMLPIHYEGSITIPIAILSSTLQELLADQMLCILFITVTISTFGALCTKLFKPRFVLNNKFLLALFNPSWIWLILRILAFVFITIIVLVEKGLIVSSNLLPIVEMISSPDTGGLVLSDLLPVLFSIFLFAGLFLPLL